MLTLGLALTGALVDDLRAETLLTGGGGGVASSTSSEPSASASTSASSESESSTGVEAVVFVLRTFF